MKWLKWTPRMLTILFILFISMFALDVFGEGYGFWGTLLALFMHLIPSFVLVGLLVWAWHKPKWGGIAFLVLAAVFTFWFDTYESIYGLLLLTLPLLITGIMFILSSSKIYN